MGACCAGDPRENNGQFGEIRIADPSNRDDFQVNEHNAKPYDIQYYEDNEQDILFKQRGAKIKTTKEELNVNK